VLGLRGGDGLGDAVACLRRGGLGDSAGLAAGRLGGLRLRLRLCSLRGGLGDSLAPLRGGLGDSFAGLLAGLGDPVLFSIAGLRGGLGILRRA
jgi:hypothetical protein